MSADEAAAFEAKMENDPGLRGEVEGQKSMVQRINHAGKKASLQVAHAAHVSKMKTVMVSAIMYSLLMQCSRNPTPSIRCR